MPDLVTLGETMVVLVAKTRGFLRHCPEFERRPGGAESTVAAGVVRLGHTAGWMSRLGDDEFGRYLLMTMQAENVDVSRVRIVADAPTGVFFRENRAAGGSAVFYYRQGSAASGLAPEDLDADYIASAKVLHLSGITPGLSTSCRETVEAALELAKAHGVTTTFDTNLRLKVWSAEAARPVLEPLMARADYLLAGREDMVKLLGPASEAEILGHLRGLGCGTVILKLGMEGAILATADGETRIPGYPVERPLDRFGAGDAFAAGFISGLLRGLPLTEAVDLANAVAGFSVQLPGNIESLPDWAAIQGFRNSDRSVAR